MKNINLSLDFETILNKIKSNKTIFLIVLWTVIFIFGISVIVSNLQIALKSHKSLDITIPSKGVRLQTSEYEEMVKRIEKGKIFSPKESVLINPFR